MKNPVMSLLNAAPEGNAIKKAAAVASLPGIPEPKKPKLSRFQQEYLDDISTRMVADTLQGTSSPAASDIMDYANWSTQQGTKYSQEKRYQDGYGDCSTYACKLQKNVYGKTVPDTTLGMMERGSKTNNPKPGTISIYDTGTKAEPSRHAVTWLPNGNVVQLGVNGVQELPATTWSNQYKLLGNYNF
jgi:hypothetical protein